MLGGFYVGDIQVFSGEANAAAADKWRESLKSLAGLNVNGAPAPEENDGTDRGPGLLSFPFAVFLAGVALTALSAVLVVGALAGLVLKSKTHSFTRPEILAAVIIAGVLLNVSAFQYQPRHLNVAAPAFLILALPVIDYLWTRVRIPKILG